MLFSASVTVCTVTVLSIQAGGHPPPPPSHAEAAVVPTSPLAVVHAWDRRRAEAWARSDVRALRSLYTLRSHTGRRDVAALRAYAGRGLHVTGMRRQVLGFRVLARTTERIVVRVRSRVVGAVAVGAAGEAVLPTARPTTYRMVLVRAADGWDVMEAYGRPPSADAITSVTSRSRNS